ncbi:hypothetical protein BH09PAT2_BH09PAT2_05250 [soil metagenome]
MNTFWDPIGDTIQDNSFDQQNQEVIRHVDEYKGNPRKIKKNLVIRTLFGIVITGIYIAFWGFNRLFIYVGVLSFMPLILSIGEIRAAQQNFILFLMCQAQAWVYNPKHDQARYDRLKNVYPDIFACGHSQEIEDQIWGSIQSSKLIDFWSGIFYYETGSGKSRRRYHHTLFAVKLFKQLPLEFTVFRKGLISFNNGDYKMESEEFNKLFFIEVKNKGPDTEMLLFKILSPSVQVRLIQLAHEYTLAGINFKNETMIVDFEREVWIPKYTNFFKKVVVDPRDTNDFIELLKKMTAVPIDMLQFMD